MKKAGVFIVVYASLLSSCKKNYQCVCDKAGQGRDYVTIRSAAKEKAEEQCKSYAGTGNRNFCWIEE